MMVCFAHSVAELEQRDRTLADNSVVAPRHFTDNREWCAALHCRVIQTCFISREHWVSNGGFRIWGTDELQRRRRRLGVEGYGYYDTDESDAPGPVQQPGDLVPRVGRRDAHESIRRNRFDRLPTRDLEHRARGVSQTGNCALLRCALLLQPTRPTTFAAGPPTLLLYTHAYNLHGFCSNALTCCFSMPR